VSIASGELEKSAIFPYQYRNFNDLQRCPDRISGPARSCPAEAETAARKAKKNEKKFARPGEPEKNFAVNKGCYPFDRLQKSGTRHFFKILCI
jgi:hypothetical protein